MKTARILSLTLLVSACSSSTPDDDWSTSPVQKPMAPDWVSQGSVLDAKRRAAFGVGSIRIPGQKALAVKSASNRARAALKQVIDQYLAATRTNYAAATPAGVDPKVEEMFAWHSINGVEDLDTYTDSGGTVYALVKLDLRPFESRFDTDESFDAATRTRLKEASSKAFTDLGAK